MTTNDPTTESEVTPVALKESDPLRVQTLDGHSAAIEHDGTVDRLCVRDPAGRLVFEYAHGTMRINVPAGDLELSAPQGAVRITSRDGVDLCAGDNTRVKVAPEKVSVKSPEAALNSQHVSLVAEKVVQSVTKLMSHVAVLEVRAGRIIERAKNVYREVDELSQLKAGRIRNVAAKAFQVLSQSLTLKADEDAKIKGEKVYLA